MRASEVFTFIYGLFEKGTLPAGRNLWGIAYNIDRYPAAIKAAARRGMDEERLEFWLKEYARRSKPEAALMLPVIVRWGLDVRPRRMQVLVPIYTMKDFDSLRDATEAALMIAVDADVRQEMYMRDMRAPDVPDVWARIEENGEEKEVQFNPLKMWRGEVTLSRGVYDLKQISVLEWCVVEREEAKKAPRPEKHSQQRELPPVPRLTVGSWGSQKAVLVAVLVALILILWLFAR